MKKQHLSLLVLVLVVVSHQAGCHVIGEKPMTSSMPEARRTVKADSGKRPAGGTSGDLLRNGGFERPSAVHEALAADWDARRKVREAGKLVSESQRTEINVPNGEIRIHPEEQTLFDDIRIYSGALSPQEILNLYKRKGQ